MTSFIKKKKKLPASKGKSFSRLTLQEQYSLLVYYRLPSDSFVIPSSRLQYFNILNVTFLPLEIFQPKGPIYARIETEIYFSLKDQSKKDISTKGKVAENIFVSIPRKFWKEVKCQ